MERGHGRTAQGPDEVDDRLAVIATPDPVLVLDRHDVDAAIQVPGGAEVVGRLVLTDPVVDLQGIGRTALRVDEGGDLPATGCGGEVVGEGGDAAAARRVGGNERGSNDDEVLSVGGCRPGRGRGGRRPRSR